MKKFLLVIALVFVGCPAGVLVAGSMQPAAYHVERSTEVSAPPDVVYGYVSDFHRFAEWSPWEKLDPSMQKTFEGPTSGTGAIYSWSGNDKVGAGRMTITDAKPQQVVARVEFSRPWHNTNQSAWAVEPEGAQTKVTWSMDGTNDGLVAKTFSLFMNMDKMVGKDYERGLEQLKSVSEAEAKKRAAAAPAMAAAQQGAVPGAAAAQAAPAAPAAQP